MIGFRPDKNVELIITEGDKNGNLRCFVQFQGRRKLFTDRETDLLIL